MGRGYRIGNFTPVPAGAGMPGSGVEAVTIVNHGEVNRIGRWKITMMVKDPEGNDVGKDGAGLRFTTIAKMENEIIPRTCFVTLGDAQVIYAPGRSLEVLAFNPMAIDLVAHWNIDEVTAGLARWEDSQFLDFGVIPAVETDVATPPFCGSFEVFGNTGDASPTLKGYAPGGSLVYTEILAVPRSGTIPRIPGLDFTITPGAGTKHVIYFVCDG